MLSKENRSVLYTGLVGIVAVLAFSAVGRIDFTPKSQPQIVECVPYKYKNADEGKTGLSGKRFRFDTNGKWRISELIFNGSEFVGSTGRHGIEAKGHDIMYVPDNIADEYATHKCTGIPKGWEYVKVEKRSE